MKTGASLPRDSPAREMDKIWFVPMKKVSGVPGKKKNRCFSIFSKTGE
jgi:hypothetical protein